MRFAMLTVVLAQSVTSPEWYTPLVNVICLGPVVYWFMKQEERRSRERNKSDAEYRDALLVLSESIMLAILSIKNIDGSFVEMAQKLAAKAKDNQQHARENSPS